MIIDCISDLHGFKPKMPGGDLLIVAGDLTARDTYSQHLEFAEWFANQQYEHKIFIAGNHDGGLVSWTPRHYFGADYLFDSETEYKGLKIWGSPWTPTFYDWHFMKDRGEPIKEKWDLIPEDVDILITHGPPYGILDYVEISSKGDATKRAGCMDLMNRIPALTKLKLHVFGHIHEGYGQESIHGTTFVNASIMDGNYRPVNKPIRIEL